MEISVQTIGFLLLPGFGLMSYASAVEPLRAANLIAARPLYRWRHFAEASGDVVSSSGASVAAEPLDSLPEDLAWLFVCAGGEPGDWHRPAIYQALRRLSRAGVGLGGISGGAYLLASAGLLNAYDFTIHWEHVPALKEAFPALTPSRARTVADRDRLTCGGGISAMEMMQSLIAERMGATFARRVSDWFLHTGTSDPTGLQRSTVSRRYGVFHPALLTVLERMEMRIEAPMTRAAAAELSGLSLRQLDRLFANHLASTYLKTYKAIRIAEAVRLLRQSPLSIVEIAAATGFTNPSHFAREVRETTGRTPSDIRRRLADPNASVCERFSA